MVLAGCKVPWPYTENQETEDDLPEQFPNIRFTVSVSLPDNREGSDLGILMLPESYSTSGGPTRLLIYCHSGGATVTMETSEAEQQDIVKYFVSQGLAVLSMAGMPDEYAAEIQIDKIRNMGGPITIESYRKGYNYIIDNYNINKNGCFLFSNSHGGLAASNIVSLTDIPVMAQSGLAPLLSIELNAWFVVSSPNYGYYIRANIIRLFNMKPVSSPDELKDAVYEKEKVGIYDPYDYLVNQTMEPYKTPYLIFASRDDEIIYYDIIENFKETLNRRGSNILIEDAAEWGTHNVLPSPVYVGEFTYQGITYPLRKSMQDVYNFFIAYSEGE
jgi:hypothetical protein